MRNRGENLFDWWELDRQARENDLADSTDRVHLESRVMRRKMAASWMYGYVGQPDGGTTTPAYEGDQPLLRALLGPREEAKHPLEDFFGRKS